MTQPTDLKPFTEHLEELRHTLLSMVATIVAAFILTFAFHETLFEFFTAPLRAMLTVNTVSRSSLKEEILQNNSDVTITYRLADQEFLSDFSSQKEIQLPPGKQVIIKTTYNEKAPVLLSPLEGINSIIKLSFMSALAISVPIWGYFCLRFLLPAFVYGSGTLITLCLSLGISAMLLGIAFGYKFFIPMANEALYAFNSKLGIPLTSLALYLDYSMNLLFASVAICEIALGFIFAVYLELISLESLLKMRKGVIIGSLIIGALLTPPDVLTQLIAAIPLWLIYEGVLLYARVFKKNTVK